MNKLTIVLLITLTTGCSALDVVLNTTESKGEEAVNLRLKAGDLELKMNLYGLCSVGMDEPIKKIFHTDELKEARELICESWKSTR